MAPRAWLLLFAAMLPVIFGKVGEDNSANISDIYVDHNAYITLKKKIAISFHYRHLALSVTQHLTDKLMIWNL